MAELDHGFQRIVSRLDEFPCDRWNAVIGGFHEFGFLALVQIGVKDARAVKERIHLGANQG